MKTVKPRFGLLFSFIAASIILCAFLLYFATPAIHYAYYANWALLATVLIFVSSPWSKKRLGEKNEVSIRYSFWPWWLRLALLELCLLLIYWGIANLCGQQLLIHTTTQTHLLAKSMYHFMICFGLLPFAAMALLAIGMGFVSYQRNQDAHMSVIFYPLLKSDSSKPLGLTLDSTTRMATHIALASTLAMMMLIFLTLISTSDITVTHGFTPTTVVTTLLVLLISFTGIFKRYLNKALSRMIPLFISIPMICVLIGLLVFVTGILIVPFIDFLYKIRYSRA